MWGGFKKANGRGRKFTSHSISVPYHGLLLESLVRSDFWWTIDYAKREYLVNLLTAPSSSMFNVVAFSVNPHCDSTTYNLQSFIKNSDQTPKWTV